MLRYTVYVEDDRYEFVSDERLATNQIASKLGVNEESIIMIDFEDAE